MIPDLSVSRHHSEREAELDMRRAVRRLCLALAALLVLPGSLVAESERYTISGRWLHDGTPQAGGLIDWRGVSCHGVVTDAAGRFTIDGLIPRWYVLLVNLFGDDGFQREGRIRGIQGSIVQRRVVLGWKDRTVELKTYSTALSGTIRSADGLPVSTAVLWLERPGPPPNPWAAGEVRWTDLTDADGYFEFRGMPPGRWRLLAQKKGSAPATAWVEVSNEQTAVRQDLVLGAPSELTFRAVGPEGQAPPTLYTTLTDLEDRTLIGTILSPDDSGRFVLNNAPAGSWRLWIRGGYATGAFDIEVPGRHKQPLQLAAMSRVRLTGHENPQVLSVRLLKDDGTLYFRPDGGLLDAQRPYRSVIQAPLGRWIIDIEGPDDYRWRSEVVVSREEDAVVEIPPATTRTP